MIQVGFLYNSAWDLKMTFDQILKLHLLGKLDNSWKQWG